MALKGGVSPVVESVGTLPSCSESLDLPLVPGSGSLGPSTFPTALHQQRTCRTHTHARDMGGIIQTLFFSLSLVYIQTLTFMFRVALRFPAYNGVFAQAIGLVNLSLFGGTPFSTIFSVCSCALVFRQQIMLPNDSLMKPRTSKMPPKNPTNP